MTPPAEHDQQQLTALADQLAQIGFCLPGTLTQRRTRCSSPGCRCRSDPPVLHGPYHSWTRKIAGKTATRTLTPAQAQRYEPWFANARQLRVLSGQLEALSLQIASRAEGWGRYSEREVRKGRSRWNTGPSVGWTWKVIENG